MRYEEQERLQKKENLGFKTKISDLGFSIDIPSNWIELESKNKSCFDAVAIDVFDNDVIFERSLYVVNTYFKKHPDNYIFMLEPPMPRQRVTEKDKYEALRQTIHKVKENAKCKNIILFDILDVEKSSTYLTTDSIHLSTEGHIMMGTNLAELIKKYL